MPIEKVKHVSKDSVQHLAKHSNLITKEQTGPDIIPDQIYSVERLNDYAVYENRFLYMLLCYLRDFVTIRYDKILKLSNQYDGVLQMDKEIVLPNRKINYTVELHDEKKDDKYLRDHNPCRNIIDRIDLILKTVMAFLSTPLMEIAGKAAKLKPPITKTNVLKMDNNFKGAVALYDFIIAYDKPGFTTECFVTELSPFDDFVAEEFSEAGALLAFLVYKHGLGMEDALKSAYELEQEARKAEMIRKKEEQLALLKIRLANMQESPEEYILALEKHLKLLQSENRVIEPLRGRVKELEQNERDLTEQLQASRQECADLYVHIEELKAAHLQELENLKQECNERINQILSDHEQELRELEQKYTAHLESLREEMRQRESTLQGRITQATEQLKEQEKEYLNLQGEHKALIKANFVSEARIKALLAEKGHNFGDAYTDQDSFNELEREFEAFVQFYDERWGKTKRKIRKKLLNYQSLKGKNRFDDRP